MVTTPGQIGRGIFAAQVAPALKRAARDCQYADQFTVKDQSAAPDAIIADMFLQSGDALAGQHYTLEYPVNGSTCQQFGFTPGPHAGDVPGRAVTKTAALPSLKIIGTIFTDAELHQIDVFGHAHDIEDETDEAKGVKRCRHGHR